ncbi:transcriptional repressor general negative regulator of transcription subunit 4, partial [Kickxella alabastrina]
IESNNRRHLANVRVVQKNLVYVIGLPTSLSTEEHLRSQDYFGQFGRINKIVINRRQTGSNSHHPTVGVYVTYATKEDATKAINAVDGSILEGRVLRATFGTTKYCSYYLRSIPCQNPGCMYLHEPGEEADSFTKEDLAANRAGLREGHEDEFDQEEELHQPVSLVANHSPNAHLSTGRVQAVPAGSFPGFQNNRIQATAQPSSSAVSSTAAPPLSHAATAASRVRKTSEINGLRPRSVEPHSADNETHTGSALPATASWASRAMAKKPSAESAADAKTRKSESSGGTMTLRMIPASRGKSASFVSTSKPTLTSAPPLLASTASVSASSLVSPVSGSSAGRDRLKSGAAASELLTSASSAPSPVSQQQQQAREKKQQTRNQTRAQQKAAAAAAAAAAAELTDAETTSEEKPEPAAKQPTKNGSSGATTRKAAAANKETTNEKRAASSTSEPRSKTAQKASEAAVVVATTSEAMAEQLEAEAEVASLAVAAGGASQIEAAASQQSDNIDERGPANGLAEQSESAQEDVISAAQDGNNDATTSDSLNVLDNDSSQLSHTSSALSFQTITDSLFAQLNAKVSTPTGTTLPAFANVSGSAYDVSYPGARIAAGFPISGTDPLLFPPSVGAESASSAAYGRMGGSGGPLDAATSPFNLFPSSQYSQSPLSALLTDPASLVGGSSRDTPISANIGGSSRQRSRWDFVQADEASAQAELQSVLGRGGSNSNIGHPQAQAPGMPVFTSSRDLGMFSTPIQGDYMGGPWGGQHADSATANTAPFPPPPGFGGRKLTESSFQAESQARSPLVPGATPVSNGIIGGSTASNTLLSRLIGSAAPDSGGMSGSGNDDSASPSTLLGGYLSQQQQAQSQQDPAILSSYMAAAVAAAGPQQQQQQQQHGQVGRTRTDPNVLNSLLARLHLGQGDGGLQLSSMGTPQGSTLSHQAFGSRAGPALGAGYQQQQQQHQQYQQHQNHNHQQGGSILPPGLMPMGAPGPATSPVYGGGQFGGGSGMGIGMNMNMGMSMGMGMGASESHMMNAGNNGSVGNRSQQIHHMQQLQQLQQLQQQQQQSLMMQRMSQAPILNAGHQPSSSNSGNGFVDPAIMNFGRMNALNNPPSMSSAMPGSPVGPPPGIASPPSGELSVAAQQQMHSMMLSRSANSSGRSRFLNHFSAETAGPKGAAANAEQEADGGGQLARDADSEEPAASNGPAMANGVPPGLPTTGLFGELLRRSKHDLVTGVGTSESPMPYPVSEADRSSKFVSGRMMLSDIEHRLDVARREARELQAQLSTVIGQNQSVMWALANNGNAGSNTSAGDEAPSHHAPHPSHGVSYTAGNM